MEKLTPKYYTSQELLEAIRQAVAGEGSVIGNLHLDIPRGKLPGLASVNKFGANADVGADTKEDVWNGGNDYPFPATALITSLSQTVDQAAMRGANIEVQGLDANWDLVVQTKALDAAATTTVVTLDTPLIRVFWMKVLANVVSDSEIRCHNAGETVDYAIIGIGHNQTLMAIYTVPAGKTAYLTKYYCTVVPSTAKAPTSTRFGLWMADRANNYEFQLKHIVGVPKDGNMVEHCFVPYAGKATEKTDIKITALPLDQAADVAAGFDLILVDN